MDGLKEIFGVTRGRPEVKSWIWGKEKKRYIKRKKKKTHGLLVTLLPKQPLGTPTTTSLATDLFFLPAPCLFFSSSFFFYFFWLSIALTHFGGETDSLLHIPDDISLDNITLIVLWWRTQYHLQCWTNWATSRVFFFFFPGNLKKKQKNKRRKKKSKLFTKDWMNNVASLLTYCSICRLGNNLT